MLLLLFSSGGAAVLTAPLAIAGRAARAVAVTVRADAAVEAEGMAARILAISTTVEGVRP